MTRTLVVFVIGILVVSLSTACGTPEVARGTVPTASQGLAASSVASPLPASPTRNTPPASPTASILLPVPTVDVAADPMAQRALADTRQQVRIKSGQPIVRLSRPVTPDELRDLGLGNWNFTPGCVPPLHLVILEGDFDVRRTMPAPIPANQEIPAKFLVYVYDLKLGLRRSVAGDPYGSLVKKALRDPTLPDTPVPSTPSRPFQMPCAPTVLPGGPAPSPARP